MSQGTEDPLKRVSLFASNSRRLYDQEGDEWTVEAKRTPAANPLPEVADKDKLYELPAPSSTTTASATAATATTTTATATTTTTHSVTASIAAAAASAKDGSEASRDKSEGEEESGVNKTKVAMMKPKRGEEESKKPAESASTKFERDIIAQLRSELDRPFSESSALRPKSQSLSTSAAPIGSANAANGKMTKEAVRDGLSAPAVANGNAVKDASHTVAVTTAPNGAKVTEGKVEQKHESVKTREKEAEEEEEEEERKAAAAQEREDQVRLAIAQQALQKNNPFLSMAAAVAAHRAHVDLSTFEEDTRVKSLLPATARPSASLQGPASETTGLTLAETARLVSTGPEVAPKLRLDEKLLETKPMSNGSVSKPSEVVAAPKRQSSPATSSIGPNFAQTMWSSTTKPPSDSAVESKPKKKSGTKSGKSRKKKSSTSSTAAPSSEAPSSSTTKEAPSSVELVEVKIETPAKSAETARVVAERTGFLDVTPTVSARKKLSTDPHEIDLDIDHRLEPSFAGSQFQTPAIKGHEKVPIDAYSLSKETVRLSKLLTKYKIATAVLTVLLIGACLGLGLGLGL